MSGPVTTHELRRFLVGELSPARRAEIEAALLADAALAAQRDALVAEDAAFKATMPFERFVADHEARVAATSSPVAKVLAFVARPKLFAGGVGLAAMAAALVVAVNLGAGPDAEAAIRRNQTKGAVDPTHAAIGYFIDERDGVRVGGPGEPLTSGDRIQFAVRDAAVGSAMVLVGVDGHGAVTVYAAEALPATREKGAKPRVLTSSVVLDDAVGAERFFLVYGDAPVDALRARAEAAARSLVDGRADLTRVEALPIAGGDVVQSSVHIVKVRR